MHARVFHHSFQSKHAGIKLKQTLLHAHPLLQIRSFIVLVTNYEDAGFKPIKHAGIKLFDITKGEEQARPLMEYCHLSKYEQESKVTQVRVCLSARVLRKHVLRDTNPVYASWRTVAFL